MIGIDDTDWEPLVEGIPGFGSLEDVVPLDVMRVAKEDGQWIFKEELPAQYLLQAKAREWKEGARAKWLRLAVRVPLGGAISMGQRLMLAAYPLGRRWRAEAEFKASSHKIAEERWFSSEVEMHAWIEGLPHDLWEKGKFLTAGLSRPDVDVKARNSAAGRKTFGVIPGHLEDVLADLFRHEKLAEAMRVTASGKLACTPKAALAAGVAPDIALHGEVADRAVELMGEAILRALAGPASRESSKWLGQPVWKLGDRIFRNLIYEENRRRGPVAARETGTARIDDFGADQDAEHDYDEDDWRS